MLSHDAKFMLVKSSIIPSLDWIFLESAMSWWTLTGSAHTTHPTPQEPWKIWVMPNCVSQVFGRPSLHHWSQLLLFSLAFLFWVSQSLAYRTFIRRFGPPWLCVVSVGAFYSTSQSMWRQYRHLGESWKKTCRAYLTKEVIGYDYDRCRYGVWGTGLLFVVLWINLILGSTTV